MAGEDDRGFFFLVVILEELADLLLREDVQPDGRLVQEDQARLVDQRGDQLHLHALAQREAAHLHVEQVLHIQQLGQLGQRGLVGLVVDLVDALVQVQRLIGRQVPPQLVLLAHDDGELHLEGFLALPGGEAEHAGLPAAGVQDAREHLERGGLAGAVGPRKPTISPSSICKRDLAHGIFGQLFAVEEVLKRALQPQLFFVIVEGFGQAVDVDDHGGDPAGGEISWNIRLEGEDVKYWF